VVRKIKRKKGSGKKREEITLKRARLQFQATSAELLEAEVILEDFMIEFNERFETGRNIPEEPGEDIQESKSNVSFEEREEAKEKEKEENRQNHEEILPEDRDLRELFKKIALKTHPDALLGEDEERKEYLTELYKEAASYAEVGDGMGLLEVAYELNLKVEIDTAKEIEWLSNKILSLQEDLSEIKNTVEWIWGQSDGMERVKVEKKIKDQLGLKIRTT